MAGGVGLGIGIESDRGVEWGGVGCVVLWFNLLQVTGICVGMV